MGQNVDETEEDVKDQNEKNGDLVLNVAGDAEAEMKEKQKNNDSKGEEKQTTPLDVISFVIFWLHVLSVVLYFSLWFLFDSSTFYDKVNFKTRSIAALIVSILVFLIYVIISFIFTMPLLRDGKIRYMYRDLNIHQSYHSLLLNSIVFAVLCLHYTNGVVFTVISILIQFITMGIFKTPHLVKIASQALVVVSIEVMLTAFFEIEWKYTRWVFISLLNVQIILFYATFKISKQSKYSSNPKSIIEALQLGCVVVSTIGSLLVAYVIEPKNLERKDEVGYWFPLWCLVLTVVLLFYLHYNNRNAVKSYGADFFNTRNQTMFFAVIILLTCGAVSAAVDPNFNNDTILIVVESLAAVISLYLIGYTARRIKLYQIAPFWSEGWYFIVLYINYVILLIAFAVLCSFMGDKFVDWKGSSSLFHKQMSVSGFMVGVVSLAVFCYLSLTINHNNNDNNNNGSHQGNNAAGTGNNNNNNNNQANDQGYASQGSNGGGKKKVININGLFVPSILCAFIGITFTKGIFLFVVALVVQLLVGRNLANSSKLKMEQQQQQQQQQHNSSNGYKSNFIHRGILYGSGAFTFISLIIMLELLEVDWEVERWLLLLVFNLSVILQFWFETNYGNCLSKYNIIDCMDIQIHAGSQFVFIFLSLLFTAIISYIAINDNNNKNDDTIDWFFPLWCLLLGLFLMVDECRKKKDNNGVEIETKNKISLSGLCLIAIAVLVTAIQTDVDEVFTGILSLVGAIILIFAIGIYIRQNFGSGNNSNSAQMIATNIPQNSVNVNDVNVNVNNVSGIDSGNNVNADNINSNVVSTGNVSAGGINVAASGDVAVVSGEAQDNQSGTVVVASGDAAVGAAAQPHVVASLSVGNKSLGIAEKGVNEVRLEMVQKQESLKREGSNFDQ